LKTLGFSIGRSEKAIALPGQFHNTAGVKLLPICGDLIHREVSIAL
jgi:hypothetical protein